MLLEKQPLSKPILDFSIGVDPYFPRGVFSLSLFMDTPFVCFLGLHFFSFFADLGSAGFPPLFFTRPGCSEAFHSYFIPSTMRK